MKKTVFNFGISIANDVSPAHASREIIDGLVTKFGKERALEILRCVEAQVRVSNS